MVDDGAASAEAVDVFIYYRLDEDCNRASALRSIRAMQEVVAARTGIAGRLLMRRDDAHTWMEIYPAVSDVAELERVLDAVGRELGVGIWIAPGTARHVERFIACA